MRQFEIGFCISLDIRVESLFLLVAESHDHGKYQFGCRSGERCK